VLVLALLELGEEHGLAKFGVRDVALQVKI
jgi:hypothetical protein